MEDDELDALIEEGVGRSTGSYRSTALARPTLESAGRRAIRPTQQTSPGIARSSTYNVTSSLLEPEEIKDSPIRQPYTELHKESQKEKPVKSPVSGTNELDIDQILSEYTTNTTKTKPEETKRPRPKNMTVTEQVKADDTKKEPLVKETPVQKEVVKKDHSEDISEVDKILGDIDNLAATKDTESSPIGRLSTFKHGMHSSFVGGDPRMSLGADARMSVGFTGSDARMSSSFLGSDIRMSASFVGTDIKAYSSDRMSKIRTDDVEKKDPVEIVEKKDVIQEQDTTEKKDELEIKETPIVEMDEEPQVVDVDEILKGEEEKNEKEEKDNEKEEEVSPIEEPKEIVTQEKESPKVEEEVIAEPVTKIAQEETVQQEEKARSDSQPQEKSRSQSQQEEEEEEVRVSMAEFLKPRSRKNSLLSTKLSESHISSSPQSVTQDFVREKLNMELEKKEEMENQIQERKRVAWSYNSELSESSSLNNSIARKQSKTIKVPQKADDKYPRSIKYIDEQIKRERVVELRQNLIRTSGSHHVLATLSEIKKNVSTKSKEVDSVKTFAIKPPFDPLDAFDEEEKEVFFSIHKERSSDKLLVTHNPMSSSYRIRVIQSGALPELSRTFYLSEFDPAFLALVPQDYGPPKTILTVQNEYIIVGTSHGQICLYNYEEKLLHKFGTSKEKGFGAVTCMDISLDNSLLVAGYDSGIIAVWDINEKKCLKYITDIHKTTMLSIKIWKTAPLWFITSDASGTVYMVELEKLVLYYNLKTQALFKKSAGPATNMSVLNRHAWAYQVIDDPEILNNTYVALASNVVVNVVCVEPNVEIVFKFPRPPYIKENSIPTIAWGHSNFRSKSEKPKIFLAVAWERIVYLFEVVEYGERIIFQIAGYLETDFEINYCGWFGYNLLFLIDNKSLIHIIHSGEFKEGDYKIKDETASDANTDEEGSSEDTQKTPKIEYIDSIKEADALPHQYVRDQRGIAKDYYHNTISQKNGEIIILGKRCFYRVTLLSWKDYLLRLLEENQWLMFLTVAIEICRGNIKELADIPLKEADRVSVIVGTIEDMMLQFIQEKLFIEIDNEGEKQIIQDVNYRSEAILSIIDFCVELEQYNLLFGKIKKIFDKLGMNDEFLKNLEPFIKLNKIKSIPDQSLREIVYFYAKKEKNKLMQQMILNLDINRLDALALQTLCLEINLNAALIHIVMDQEDVVIPFIKLINEYMRGPTPTKPIEEVKKSGYQCLWLLKMCFKGRLCFSTKTLPDEKWKNILQNILAAAFEKEYLKALFEIEPVVTTNLMLLLFTNEAARIIDSLEENTSGVVVTDTPNSDCARHQEYFEKIVECLQELAKTDKRREYRSYLGFFVAKVIRTSRFFFVEKGLCQAFIKHLLKNPDTLTTELLIMNFKMNLPYTNRRGQAMDFLEELNNQFSADFITNEKNELILALVKYVEPSDYEIDEYIRDAQLSPFSEVTSYLYFLGKQYKKAFETFLPGTVSPGIKVPLYHIDLTA